MPSGAVVRTVHVMPPAQPPSDHWNGKTFYNRSLEGRLHQDLRDVFKWMATRDRTPWKRIDEAPGPAPEPRVSGGEVRVTLVGHATVLVQQDGVNFLTDPIWAQRCSPIQWAGPKRFRSPAIRFEDLPPIDVVLLSHDHYDHLCIPTMRRLRDHSNPLVVTGLGVGAILRKHGIPNVRELDWWQSTTVNIRRPGVDALPLEITFTEAQHFSGRGPHDRDRTLWGGLFVDAPSGPLYYAGDTGYGPHFVDTYARLAAPRTALIPIGAYAPRWFMAPVHIDPSQAVMAHQELRAGTSVAVHYGTFALADDGQDQPVRELAEALDAAGVSRDAFRVLDHGRGTPIPQPLSAADARRSAAEAPEAQG